MGNFIEVDEPMGPGFLIFFKKVRKSADVVNIRPPKWLYEKIDRKIVEIPRFEEIRDKAKKSIREVKEVKKAVHVLFKSEYVPNEIKELIESRDLVEEVSQPQFDSDYILIIILQWYLVIQILYDDEDAILVLMLS